MTAFVLCESCGTPIEGGRTHDFHDIDCDRFLAGFCRCDGVVCIRCCPDEVCGPLAAALIVARQDTLARAEKWEAAREATGA